MTAKLAYEFDDYKALLHDTLLVRKETISKSYTFQSMAKACRVQKTYLSRVFNGDAHLNDDQVFLAGEYLGMTTDERHFLALLHQHARSVVPQKKRLIERDLSALKKKHLMSESHLAARQIGVQPEAADLAQYYLEPDLQLLHMYLTIDRYAREPQKLRDLLGMPEEAFAKALSRLGQLGLVVHRAGKYEVLTPTAHLSPESPVFKPYRTLLRLRAMERLGKAQAKDAYTFSVLFSADEATRQRVQARFLEFLKAIEQDVQAAPAEDVYFLGFDLLRW